MAFGKNEPMYANQGGTGLSDHLRGRYAPLVHVLVHEKVPQGCFLAVVVDFGDVGRGFEAFWSET
jgi:hypothetical protein